MKIISVRNIDKFVESTAKQTPKSNKKAVEFIIDDVKKNRDKAVRKYEKKFSQANIKSLLVSKNEIKEAYSQTTKDQISAIKLVKKRLTKTENALKEKLQKISINVDGARIEKTFIPISSVGCYVPGGLAQYPSSLVMSATPAKIAGVKRIVAVSPPNKNGKINPLTLVAADICGVTEFYKTGGTQAIAALSYGTQSIPKVDKIVGPGGSFVTFAKYQVSNKTSIDMLAGPTELAIIADSSADPDIIARDLISQAEHSVDTFCYLVTTSYSVAEKVGKSVEKIISNITRKKIVTQSLTSNGFIAVCKTQIDIIKLINKLAPEHLEILTKNPKHIASKITTAGLVLIGKNTPSAASDYLLGSNHILPTSGFGKTRGPLSVLDFMKVDTQIEASKNAMKKISKYMKTLTASEDLLNHYEAVRSRLS